MTQRSNRILADYQAKMTRNFNDLVYYNIQGLILAGTDYRDISLIESSAGNTSSTIYIKGLPAIKIEIKNDIENTKITFHETFYKGKFQPLLDEFVARRKSQPPSDING